MAYPANPAAAITDVYTDDSLEPQEEFYDRVLEAYSRRWVRIAGWFVQAVFAFIAVIDGIRRAIYIKETVLATCLQSGDFPCYLQAEYTGNIAVVLSVVFGIWFAKLGWNMIIMMFCSDDTTSLRVYWDFLSKSLLWCLGLAALVGFILADVQHANLVPGLVKQLLILVDAMYWHR
jgi:hypothetical protein